MPWRLCAPASSLRPEHPLTNAQLVFEAHQGLSLARRQLAYQLTPRLTRMAAHYARRSGEDADDLLQEAWLSLLEALADVDPTLGQPEQYLLRRARWGLLDAVRRARRRRCAPLDEAAEPSAPAHDVPLGDFFARLGATQRQVAFGLLDGLTFRELGDELACTSANVAYHVSKLREAHGAWSQGVFGAGASPDDGRAG